MAANQIDFPLNLDEDGVLTVSLAPPTAISGFALQYTMFRRFGGVPLVTKFVASGFNGSSGISVVDGSKGILNVSLWASEVSGYEPGAYAYLVARTDSGNAQEISKGYRLAN